MVAQLLVGAILKRAVSGLSRAGSVFPSSPPDMSMTVEIPPTRSTLENLTASMERGGFRRTMRKASTPVARATRANMPVRTGLAKRSVGTKIRARRRDLSAYGIVGISRKVKVPDPRRKKGVYQPSKTFHLIEKGYISKSARRVPGRFPLKRAWGATRSRSLAIIRSDLEKDIRLEWARRMKGRIARESARMNKEVDVRRIARRIQRY